MAGEVFLAGGAALQVAKGSALVLGLLFGRPMQTTRAVQGIVLKLLEKDARGLQKVFESPGMGNGAEGTAEANAIEAAEDALDFVLMALDKRAHGVAPRVRMSGKNITLLM